MQQIDFHAHVLPKCDHGSNGTETSLKQLSLAAEAGVGVICATPHFYPERENVEAFLVKRENCNNALKERSAADSPRIMLGAEVLCFEGIERLPGLNGLCLEGTDILLLEMPFKKWSDGIVRSVEKLSERDDITIVLAHVDRYPKENVDELLSFGLYAQLNVENCCGLFFDKKFKEWVDDGYVVAFGSDIHGTETGYVNWKKTQKKRSALWDAVMERTNGLIGL